MNDLALLIPTSSDLNRKEPHVPVNGDNTPVSVNGDTASDSGNEWHHLPFDADARHRIDFARYASRHGHEPCREPISRIYEAWEGWNHAHFGSQLLPPHFMLAEPKSPRALGDHSILSGWGSTNQIRIRPSILNGSHPIVRPGDDFAEGRFLLVLDIALHETLHQFATEVLKQPEEAYHGHGPVFRDTCNRIGETLGLPPVRTAKARGRDRDLPSCAEWPICVRPTGYYLGAYLPHEEAATGEAAAEQAPPEPPKVLAEWLTDHPEWAEQFRSFGDIFFALLDRFFDTHPAPDAVEHQAVMFLAKCYRHHRRSRPTRSDSLPAVIHQ